MQNWQAWRKEFESLLKDIKTAVHGYNVTSWSDCEVVGIAMLSNDMELRIDRVLNELRSTSQEASKTTCHHDYATPIAADKPCYYKCQSCGLSVYKHVRTDTILLSYPPQYECKICGKIFS